ncbi:hypothetical protein [uncultured Fibrobacter sp.]|uniref:hypothetical protein n=1 Tax=uncultured Fibrobacter sp. TaxID=261512 RepID=UPI002618EDF4|nr:hypothetical protein [uncultured Fibrobacter sp.]
MKKVARILAGTIVLSLMACSEGSKTSGVTEDENAVAHNDSSSSTTSVSSSSKDPKSSGSSMLELWNGGKGMARVNVGNDNAGYWFSFTDEGGLSKVLYPVEVDSAMSEEAFEPVVSYCEGLCATVELKGTSLPMAGVGFTVAEEGAVSDISEWGGICVAYVSDFAMNVLLSGNAAGDTLNLESPFVTLPKTIKNVPTLDQLLGVDNVVTRCAKWSDFEAPAWVSESSKLSGEEAASQIKTIVFIYKGNSDEVGRFNIKEIGKYDATLPQWSEPVNVTDFVSSSSSGDTGNDSPMCMWNGASGEYRVNTGFGDGSETSVAGHWYSFDDAEQGGASHFVWKADCSMNEAGCMEYLIDVCGGFCGKLYVDKGTAKGAHIGVAFRLDDYEPGETLSKPVDVTDWGGLCVTYSSKIGFNLIVGIDSVEHIYFDLDKTEDLVEKCMTWDDFDEYENEIPGAEAVKQARFISLEQSSGESMIGEFNIVAIGKYSETGACGVGKLVQE